MEEMPNTVAHLLAFGTLYIQEMDACISSVIIVS